jgi:CDP-diacylglycerol--glycerol-3-phosphate 3-phosphatidyltransferase
VNTFANGRANSGRREKKIGNLSDSLTSEVSTSEVSTSEVSTSEDSKRHRKMTTESNQASSEIFNVPNKISAARLVLSFVFFALLPFKLYWLALVVFLVAAGTDWVDGWYARKYDMVTKLGRVLDPFCDKILICGAYILLAVEMDEGFSWYAKIAGWMAVVVVGRELLVTVLRSMIEGAGGDFSAKMAGKLKMWFQCIAVGACLVGLALHANSDQGLPSWLHLTIIVSVWVSIISTLHSGWLYVIGAADFLKA